MKKIIYAVVIFSCIVFGIFSVTGQAAYSQGKKTSEEGKRVIAHSEADAHKAVEQGCRIVRKIKTLHAVVCSEKTADILGFEEDVRVFATDAGANHQIGADTVQAGGNTGAGRKVVVIDTGYNYLHPELASSYLEGKDFVNGDDDPMDDNGHGSHVAGIITADGINPQAKGVAPDAGIIAGKVLDAAGSGFFSDVVAGIYWAIDGPDGIASTSDDFHPDAINMSLGTARPYVYKNFCDSVLPDVTAAIQYARQRGTAVVVAAGNSGSAGVSIPGCVSYSVTIGAVDALDKIASFSGRGNAVDLTAPGVSIFSSYPGGYATLSGTSMATPMVSGVIALLKAAQPTLSESAVESKLFKTAKDLGRRGKDPTYGWGRVNAQATVSLTEGTHKITPRAGDHPLHDAHEE
ncbi:MAG: subtilisin [Parcubacteria group bacterium Gr01-1014_29]|nr:MAG: subtilisin [Parcubacteria group bacterium Gr01-1014_29]